MNKSRTVIQFQDFIKNRPAGGNRAGPPADDFDALDTDGDILQQDEIDDLLAQINRECIRWGNRK